MLKKHILLLILLILLITPYLLNSDETLVISEDGNVGINNDNPQEQLEISGNMQVNGNIEADWYYCKDGNTYCDFLLNSGTSIAHPLVDANGFTGLYIIFWRGGDVNTEYLTFTTVDAQTIDGLPASTWKGHGRGKLILASYDEDNNPLTLNANWIVVDYSDSGWADGFVFQKFADGTMQQWGKPDIFSPETITFPIQFVDVDPDENPEVIVLTGAARDNHFTSNYDSSTNYPGIGSFKFCIMKYDTNDDCTYSTRAHWLAVGRWY